MVFEVLCSGEPWRGIAERYSLRRAIYNRFNPWSKSGYH
ncbi:transposase [Edwardsiella anguillarum]|nr:transposase [Edwardsiella anguillarum]QBB14417.1 hypothetical protein EVK84_09695 [Edwardsiella piscicida]RFT03452.1 hypothetical protein CGL57_11515 [Edwardsiella anguillarum]